jgi:hypothetical protein
MENNYDPNILEWANVHHPIKLMYDYAHVNVLEEALPFQTYHKSKGIEGKNKIQDVVIAIMWI